jgi:hypothetical protein
MGNTCARAHTSHDTTTPPPNARALQQQMTTQLGPHGTARIVARRELHAQMLHLYARRRPHQHSARTDTHAVRTMSSATTPITTPSTMNVAGLETSVTFLLPVLS